MERQKLVVVLGPTSSGKSELAVKLAKKFNGEVVSADSRQVYRGLDIGTGKFTKEEMEDVTHHLIDVAEPNDIFSAADFKRLAEAALGEIASRGKLPIIAGGTGFYIQALIDEDTLPNVPPDQQLRKELEIESAGSLFDMLKKLDPRRAKTIEQKNPRRLVRAIEIAKKLGKVPYLKSKPAGKYNVLLIGIKTATKELNEQIKKRVEGRLKKGMTEEAEHLYKKGLSLTRMKELGLGYRCLAEFLEKKINEDELQKCVMQEERRYAKRQMRWFKRDRRIKWFSPAEYGKIEREVERFLK